MFTIQKVIRSTFLNPDRKKFPKSKVSGLSLPLHSDNLSADELISRVTAEISFAVKKFNEQGIELFDTNRLYKEVNIDHWLTRLQYLRWYGPFKYDENSFYFQTATSVGNFEGFELEIYLHPHNKIYLYYLDKNSSSCGDYYLFNN